MAHTVYSFVVDRPGQFGYQAYLLIRSLIELAHVQPANISAHVTSTTDPTVNQALAALGVETVTVEPFGHPYCNRLQQLPHLIERQTDQVVLLDTDMFALRPFDLRSDGAVLGKMVDLPNPPMPVLDRIFAVAGVVRSEACTDLSAEATVRGNLNAGMYVVPRAVLPELSVAWKRWARWSLEHLDLFVTWRNNVDQVSFALAVAELGIQTDLVSRAYNLPTHLPAVTVDRPPVLLHYHRNVDNQLFLRPTNDAAINEAIADANAAIRRWRREDLNNTLFWSARYDLFPELGSGVGSRGDVLDQKRLVLRRFLGEVGATSVVDIGGGDGATMEGLTTGLEHRVTDVAPGAADLYLERNPGATFSQADITATPAPQADVAVCLDLLIHLADRETYLAAVRNVIASGRLGALMSGFDAPPTHPGTLTHYHEPLLETIARDPERLAFPLTAYHEVVLYAVLPEAGAGHARDVRGKTLRRALAMTPNPSGLLDCVLVSRSELGFFPDHLPRCLEYPWVRDHLKALGKSGLRILDVGAGVNVLPVILADDHHEVVTIDPHPIVRDSDDRAAWNEWGYLDYASLRPHVQSFHIPYESFVAAEPFDAIYSVSVIEHLPAAVRRQWCQRMATQLAPDGRVLLTVDLEPFSRRLWRMSEGQDVEPAKLHGTLDDLLHELRSNGLEIEQCETRPWLPASRVGLAFIVARLPQPEPRSDRPHPTVFGSAGAEERLGGALAATGRWLGDRTASLRTRLRFNPLFDFDWYVRNNPDVPRLWAQRHYRRHGVHEGRRPNPWFDTAWYLRHYPEARARAGNPLDDYLIHGVELGLDPGPEFSTRAYLEHNPDVAASGMNPLLHYLRHGQSEGRERFPSRVRDVPSDR